MRQRIFLRTIAILVLASAALSLPAMAQDNPQDSVAEAARRARAQKKSAAKPATVVTDDTLKRAPAASVPTDNSPSAAAAASANAGAVPDAQAPPATPAPSAEDEKRAKAEADALKQQIAAKQAEVDLAQRELALDNDAYYSKANYQNDKAGAAKLATEQSDLNQKKNELAALKAKLPAAAANEPAQTAPPKP